jgi:hypothetical protein
MKTYAKNRPVVQRPLRDPDHISKRGVYYWWAPEWVRGTSSANTTFVKIKAILKNGDVDLHMVSKDGNMTHIQGSIQQEFKDWHDDRQIDYIILGETPESASELIITETEDVKYES